MITIIIGTNRSGSYSFRVAREYCAILEELGLSHRILHLKSLPPDFIFSALYEKSGEHEGFNEIQKMVDESEKFIFIVPEYNGSFPGVLKAFIDGLAFPSSFRGKVAGLVGISSGSIGASLAMSHLTDILNYLGMFVLPSKPRLMHIEEQFEERTLKNEKYKLMLRKQAEQLRGISVSMDK